jgi:hypothetical protein
MDNVALAHLLYEDAMLTSCGSVSGRAFTVTDPNPALAFQDIYTLLSALTPFTYRVIPAVPMHIIAQLVEIYCVVREVIPLMSSVLPAMPPPMDMMQPAMLQVANSFQFASNDVISKPVSEGGLAYRGIYTTMEGMCTEVRNWVDDHGGKLQLGEGDETGSLKLKNVGAAPAIAQG